MHNYIQNSLELHRYLLPHEKTKPEKLDDGLLRHGGGAVRRADAAGGRDPHCHVHCACAGRVSDRDSVCGVRAHHGAHGLRGGQPAGAFVCAGQGSGPDLRVPAGVLPAGKTPVRPHPPGRAAVRVQAAAVQRRRAGDVRPAAGAHPGGQHLTGAAHHGVDSYPVHAGHGQRGLFAVRPGPAQPAHAVPVGVAA